MFVIARRELLERVKSKWFAAITLLGPIGMVAMVLVPSLLAGAKTSRGVVAGILAPALHHRFHAAVIDHYAETAGGDVGTRAAASPRPSKRSGEARSMRTRPAARKPRNRSTTRSWRVSPRTPWRRTTAA